MARLRFLLALAGSAAYISPGLQAQETRPLPSPPPLVRGDRPEGDRRHEDRNRDDPHDKDHDKDHNKDRDKDREFQDPRLKEIRELFEKLPEDLRKQLIDRTRRWQQMPADEQAHFRFMQGEREKRAQQAVEQITQTSGLKLDDAQRLQLADIYKRERRKLEQSLRDEMDQRRTERLPELQKSVLEAYRTEVATPPAAPTPSASPVAPPPR